MFSPWRYNVDKASEAPAAGGRVEQPRSRSLSDGCRAGGALPGAAGDPDAAGRACPHRRARHVDLARGPRQGQDGGAGEGALRDPLQQRQGTERAARRRGDRCLRHVGHAEPRGGQRARSHRRGRARRPHRLRHARRARCRTGALCRQDRGRAGRGAFGHRHHHRSCPPQGDGARNPDRLAPAGRQPGEIVRRRRQRQAGGARRAGLAVCRHRAPGRRARRDRVSASSHVTTSGRTGFASARDRHAAVAT